MKNIAFLTLIIIVLVSCEKSNPVPGDITYPEYHNGKINLLAIQSDTFYVDTTTYFSLAADVPAHRSIKFVLQPAAQPATEANWGGMGMTSFPSNPHLAWDFSTQRMVYNSLPEELEEDKLCVTSGVMGGAESWWSTTGIIHLIIYEDETEWMTRYITLVPVQ